MMDVNVDEHFVIFPSPSPLTRTKIHFSFYGKRHTFSTFLSSLFHLAMIFSFLVVCPNSPPIHSKQSHERIFVATPLWPSVRMKFTLPKLGTWSPPGLPNF
jgi:hypothetical protein